MLDLDLDDLAGELAEFAPAPKKEAAFTAREERIIAGFEEIERFYEQQGRPPLPGDDRDIFERLYAVRLDRLRSQEDCRLLLAGRDKHGLLDGLSADHDDLDDIDADALAAELGDIEPQADITRLRHVRSAEEKREAEEIANRDKCEDFDQFKPLFQAVKDDLATGTRATRPFEGEAEIREGVFFIVGGQFAYVAERGELFSTAQGRTDARLRVIYDNGTESNLLLRSLQRALHRDEAGRRVTDPAPGPLFADRAEDGETETGTIYVLRSRSNHPFVAEHREVLHKIGVTSGAVEARISGAERSSTYLLAGVDVVATYKVYGVNCQKLEGLLHKVFAPGQVDFTIEDRFGNPVRPREWFIAPLHVIDEAVERIRQRTIVGVTYSPTTGTLA